MAAARLAAMKERIKNKANAEAKRVDQRVTDMCAKMDQDEAAEKAQRRIAMLEKLKADAAENAAKNALSSPVKEPDAKRMRLQGAPDIPKCSCGILSVRAAVEKEGAHLGRPFYKCPRPRIEQGCTFFAWEELLAHRDDAGNVVDMSVPAADQKEVLCRCGVPGKQFTVRKEGPNLGKTFRKCAEDKCKFFAWDAQPGGGAAMGAAAGAPTPSGGLAMGGLTPSGGQESSGAARQCSCGSDAKLLQVRKEGPNMGRSFWKCDSGQCKFFEWDQPATDSNQSPSKLDDVNTTAATTQAKQQFTRGGSAATSTGTGCYKCGQSGHWARDCPAKAQQQAEAGA